MATLKRTSIHAELLVELQLSESEVRALDGIFGYNVEHFLKVFYEKCGKEYVRPHEAGVRALHKTIRAVLAGPIAEIDKARRAVSQALNG